MRRGAAAWPHRAQGRDGLADAGGGGDLGTERRGGGGLGSKREIERVAAARCVDGLEWDGLTLGVRVLHLL
jgi:hypothetical protein